MDKRHYYLVSGEVVFINPDETLGTLRLNTVTRTRKQMFTASNLGESQQALQMQFHRQCETRGVPLFKIFDVFIFATSYLGHMSEEEFQKPPIGTEKVAMVETISKSADPFAIN